MHPLDHTAPPRNITRFQKEHGHPINGYRVKIKGATYYHLRYFSIPAGDETSPAAWRTALKNAIIHLRHIKAEHNIT